MGRDTRQKMKQSQPMQVSKIGDRQSRGRKITRPDRILANRLAMEMIKSLKIVRERTLPGHLPLKLTLNTAPLKQRSTVVKVPKPFPIEEIEETTKEACSKRASELANEKREEIEQALRDGHDDQAWSLVSAVAESYLEWRCSSSKGDRRKGGKGRCGEPKTKECFLAAGVGEISCESPATRFTRKLQKSRRQAVEIQTKLNSRKAEEIDTRMQIVQLWSKIKKAIQKNRVPCQPLWKCLFPAERDIQWFLNATQAMIKKIDKEAAERRIQNWLSKMKRVLNRKTSSKDARWIGRRSRISSRKEELHPSLQGWHRIKMNKWKEWKRRTKPTLWRRTKSCNRLRSSGSQSSTDQKRQTLTSSWQDSEIT